MSDDALIQGAEAAARALLDRRIELIRELATSSAELEPLQKAAAEGEQRAFQAWSDALAGGWTPDELRKLGYREPDKRGAGKKAAPKKPAAVKLPEQPTEPAQGPDHPIAGPTPEAAAEVPPQPAPAPGPKVAPEAGEPAAASAAEPPVGQPTPAAVAPAR